MFDFKNKQEKEEEDTMYYHKKR